MGNFFGLRVGDTVHLNSKGKLALAEKAEDKARKLEGEGNDFKIIGINQDRYLIQNSTNPSIKFIMNRDQINMGKGRIFKNILKGAAMAAAAVGAIYGGRKLSRNFRAARMHRDREIRDYAKGRMVGDAPDELMRNKFGQALKYDDENVLTSGEGLNDKELKKQFAIYKGAKKMLKRTNNTGINVDAPEDTSIGYEKITNGIKNAGANLIGGAKGIAASLALPFAMNKARNWAMEQSDDEDDDKKGRESKEDKPVGKTKLGDAVYQNSDGAYFKYGDNDEPIFLTEDEFEKIDI